MNDQTLIYSMVLDVFRDTNRIGFHMMWEAIESLVYMYGDKPEDLIYMPVEINQCDGCRRNLPLIAGIHQGDGYDMIACTKERY